MLPAASGSNLGWGCTTYTDQTQSTNVNNAGALQKRKAGKAWAARDTSSKTPNESQLVDQMQIEPKQHRKTHCVVARASREYRFNLAMLYWNSC